MPNRTIHKFLGIVIGLLTTFACVHANPTSDLANGQTEEGQEDTVVQVITLQVALGDLFECWASDPGYAWLVIPEDTEDDGEELEEVDERDQRVAVYLLGYGLPVLLQEVIFDPEELALNGSAMASIPIDPGMNDQIVTVANETGEYIVLLENTDDNAVGIECTILEANDLLEAATYGTVTKKRKAINNANKRKVKKKAARKKAAVKRKKAVRKKKATSG